MTNLDFEAIARRVQERDAIISNVTTPEEILRIAAEGHLLTARLHHLRSEIVQQNSDLEQLARFARSCQEERPAAVIDVKG